MYRLVDIEIGWWKAGDKPYNMARFYLWGNNLFRMRYVQNPDTNVAVPGNIPIVYIRW